MLTNQEYRRRAYSNDMEGLYDNKLWITRLAIQSSRYTSFRISDKREHSYKKGVCVRVNNTHRNMFFADHEFRHDTKFRITNTFCNYNTLLPYKYRYYLKNWSTNSARSNRSFRISNNRKSACNVQHSYERGYGRNYYDYNAGIDFHIIGFRIGNDKYSDRLAKGGSYGKYYANNNIQSGLSSTSKDSNIGFRISDISCRVSQHANGDHYRLPSPHYNKRCRIKNICRTLRLTSKTHRDIKIGFYINRYPVKRISYPTKPYKLVNFSGLGALVQSGLSVNEYMKTFQSACFKLVKV